MTSIDSTAREPETRVALRSVIDFFLSAMNCVDMSIRRTEVAIKMPWSTGDQRAPRVPSMYEAAMSSSGCKLTAMGLHDHRLAMKTRL